VAAINDAGKIAHTEDKSRAQSFHGAEWVRAWAGVRGATLVFSGERAAILDGLRELLERFGE
jgi:hypothetical protein